MNRPGRRLKLAVLPWREAVDVRYWARNHPLELLEAEGIPFHMVGTHRRIRFEDLREYKLRDDLTRRRAADDLAKPSQELGLY